LLLLRVECLAQGFNLTARSRSRQLGICFG